MEIANSTIRPSWIERHPSDAGVALQEIQAKIRINRRKGWNAFKTGEYNPWAGYDYLKGQNTFEWKYKYTEESLKDIDQRVIAPLKDLAIKYGVNILFAGRGAQPPHTTIDAAVFKGFSDSEKRVIIDWLGSYRSHIRKLGEILLDQSFGIDTLVMGPSTYICDGQFGPKQATIFRARQLTEKIWSRYGGELEKKGIQTEGKLEPLYAKYTDIFQITCGFIKQIADPEALLQYCREAYNTVGRDLEKKPVIVQVKSVSFGQSSELQFRDSPPSQIVNRPANTPVNEKLIFNFSRL